MKRRGDITFSFPFRGEQEATICLATVSRKSSRDGPGTPPPLPRESIIHAGPRSSIAVDSVEEGRFVLALLPRLWKFFPISRPPTRVSLGVNLPWAGLIEL